MNAGSPSASSKREEQPVGDEKAERRPELREHAEPAALALRRIFRRQQRRAAPFAAKAEALAEAQQAEQPGRQRAGRFVRGQRADQGGGKAHHQHRGDKRRLAADAVAEMAEEEGADRTREKGDAEGEESVERLRRRIGGGKERLAEHERRRRAVNVEIVEFDGGADKARHHDAA